MTLIECIPNFSEGRRPDVIQAIQSAIADGGASVLDVSSDADHNRTVVTVAGTPEQVEESAYRGIQTAARHIDLAQHDGVHPRIGATDVVPFVPLEDATMADCVQIVRQLGQRVGEALSLPVYLYEEAARQINRTNLADIRRGNYEGLQSRIDSDPDMQPDYGPTTVGPAGAVVIGARGPLIAFNAYLDTDDVQIARQIARAVRTSSGGLPHLKALGLLVDGRTQVSMNVIDYRQTSLHTILEAVRDHARQRGARVTETELVGLVPQQALIDAALQYLQLPVDIKHKTIEQRLNTVTHAHKTITFE